MTAHRLSRASLILVAGIALSLGGPSGAEARSLTLTSPADAGTTCTFSLDGRPLGTTTATAPGSARVRVLLNASAASGRYRLALSCPPRAAVTRVVRVTHRRRPRHRMPLVAGPVTLRTTDAGAPAPAPAAPSAPAALPLPGPAPKLPAILHPVLSAAAVAEAATLWNLSWAATYVSGLVGTGECVDLVERMRPDIVPRVMQDVIARWFMGGSVGDIPLVSWDAMYWDANAASAGMPVGASPRVGAVMVFHPSPMTGPVGHVAYVTAVGSDGSVTVTEEHAPVLGAVTQHRYSAADLSGQDVDFVY